ncbi:ATP-binding protein [Dactylosporangium siamense]|uniref:histidine kinase n=1 Tax=Dactylosporangium siamense TaxID=685454 RepID=A0A919PWV4_9ACTN|nr:HAMP domain-containing sensor histidine kinase [Dactylosporangium siamense]GIG50093.1 two-component sensor histidine kinase [Dactylosporangium siamense]
MKGPFRQWWRRRTLHDRLSLLVTAAVAAAVLTVAGIAFAAVSQIQREQLQSQLDTDAREIAAQPEQWRDGGPPLGPAGRRDLRHRRDIGPRWQFLGRDATVVAGSTNGLPVTDGARRVAAGQAPRQQERVDVDGRSYLMLTVPADRGGGAVQVAADQGPANRTLTVFGLLMAAGCILGIGGAAALGRTVARAGLVPVQQLTKAVEDVAVTMDLNRPVPIHGVDEIARLGQSVNTMLAAIDAARQSQRTLVEDASHELRTPLTSIRTNIELLLAVERQPELAHRLPPEERAKLLRDLDAQVGELAALTTELVELAREETTREPAEDVELTDVADAAIDRVRIRVPAVTFSTDLRPVTVHGRPNELERMLVNVLDNAAKWSPPGGVVHTELSIDGDGWARLVVTDGGPGIDAADLPHVFDRFYRAAAARGMPGSGLGLAIVAQTAAQHGGTVTAGPNHPHGTVVTVRFPPA